MGREIPNPPEDTAKLLTCILNFLMPPFQLGNLAGDAERYDPGGNLLIVKEEPVSDTEPANGDPYEEADGKDNSADDQINNTKSESDEVEIIGIEPQGTTKLNPVALRRLRSMAKARAEQEKKFPNPKEWRSSPPQVLRASPSQAPRLALLTTS